jgi:quinol-cytochrome oxidoreductase complex cytochrome b subunit
MSEPQPTTQALPTLGVAVIGLVLLLAITGIVLEFAYMGAADHAYQSVAAIDASGFWRWLRAVHHWTAAATLILGGLYVALGLFEGAYRKPNQLRWIVVVVAVVLFVGFQLTGRALPWDSGAVRMVTAETAVAADVPGVGDMKARFLRAGDTVGPQTLPQWHQLHIYYLPAVFLLLVAVPLGFLRSAGRGSLAFGGVLIVAILFISAALPAPPVGPAAAAADYAAGPYTPDWCVYPLHALMQVVQRIGLAAWVGAALIPLLAILFLLLLPWLDRSKEGALWVKVVGALGLLAFGALAVVGHNAAVSPPPAQKGAVATAEPAPPTGSELFVSLGCRNCHSLAGEGGDVGPPLDGVGTRQPSREWHIAHLKDPAAVVPGSTMPRFDNLSAEDLLAIADYLVGLKDDR